MLRAILISLLALLAPAPSWAGAGSLRTETVGLSSGTDTAGITNGRLDVNATLISSASAVPSISDSGTLTAAGQSVVIAPGGFGGVAISVTGVWVGTIVFEQQAGDGSWNNIELYSEDTGSSAEEITVNQFLQHSIGSIFQLRLRASGWTSGTATISYNLAVESSHQEVIQPDPSALGVQVYGFATSSSPMYADGDIRGLSLDLNGNLRVSPNSSGSLSPGTVGAGEAVNNRAFLTTFELILGNGGVEDNAILLRNPSGSGKRAYIREITFGNTTGASKSVILRVYSNPTVTSTGTTLTPRSMFIGGGAPTPVILVTTVPTTSALGTKVTVAAQTNEQAVVDYDWGLILGSNNSLLITGTGTANNVPLVVNIIWSEAI